MFIVKLKDFTIWVKGLKFKSDRKNQDVPKIKIYKNHLNWDILEGGKLFFGGGSNFRGLSICNGYCVSDILRIGGKILQEG